MSQPSARGWKMKEVGIELKKEEYQNSVIADGKLIADWDDLYNKFNDPWDQSKDYQVNSASRILIRHYCEVLRQEYKVVKTLELGCGLAYLTEDLHKRKFTARGTDISQSCVQKALARNEDLDLHTSPWNDKQHLIAFEPDVIIMSQLTWYILDELDDFLKLITGKRKKEIFLVHSLATYEDGVQEYGKEYFTNLDGILKYFNLDYLFSGEFQTKNIDKVSRDTLFVAKI